MVNPETDYLSDEYVLLELRNKSGQSRVKASLSDYKKPPRNRLRIDNVTYIPERQKEIVAFNNINQLLDKKNPYLQDLIRQYIKIDGPKKVWNDANHHWSNETKLPLIALVNGAVFEWLSYLSISQLPYLEDQGISVLNPLESRKLYDSYDSDHINPDGVLYKKKEDKSELLAILEYKLNLDRASSYDKFTAQLKRMTNFASRSQGKKVHFSNNFGAELTARVPLEIFLIIPEDKTFDTDEKNVHTIHAPFQSRFISDLSHATILDMKNQSTASSNRSTNDSSINNFS